MDADQTAPVKERRYPVFGLCGVAAFVLMLAGWLIVTLANPFQCTGESCLGVAMTLGVAMAFAGFIGLACNVIGIVRREQMRWYVILALIGNFGPGTTFLILFVIFLLAQLHLVK